MQGEQTGAEQQDNDRNVITRLSKGSKLQSTRQAWCYPPENFSTNAMAPISHCHLYPRCQYVPLSSTIALQTLVKMLHCWAELTGPQMIGHSANHIPKEWQLTGFCWVCSLFIMCMLQEENPPSSCLPFLFASKSFG